MKQTLFSIFFLLLAATAIFAQSRSMYVHSGGKVIYSKNVSQIDSVTFVTNDTVSVIPVATVKSSIPEGSLTFMTCNLGADLNMSVEQQMTYIPVNDMDETVYGALFQWGRASDGHERRTSGRTSSLSFTDTPAHDYFILSSGEYNSDWCVPSNNSLWQNVKTANDPCPKGFRVPTQREWASIFDAGSGNRWTWNDTGIAGYRISTDGGATCALFLPAAGLCYCYDGELNSVGLLGDYWSSVGEGIRASCLGFYDTYVDTNIEISRATGASVRCVAEY